MEALAAEILAGEKSGAFRRGEEVRCQCASPHRTVGRFYTGQAEGDVARAYYVVMPYRRPGPARPKVAPYAAHVPREGELAWTMPGECPRCHRIYAVFLGGLPAEFREALDGPDPHVAVRHGRPSVDELAAGDDTEVARVANVYLGGPHGVAIVVTEPVTRGRVVP